MKSGKQKERELIIKLSKERKTVREIGDILGISKSKAAFWIGRYKKTGNLKDKPRSGKPTPLTRNKLSKIKEKIKSELLDPGRRKAGISSKEVAHIIEQEIGKRYTLRHIQRILHKIGFSFTTPRVSHIKKDKKAQEKFKKEFKKNSTRNMWIIQS